ncbi:MAG: leucine-rich repeat domain-containing protein [Candidatus Thorarchaeota archaeon]
MSFMLEVTFEDGYQDLIEFESVIAEIDLSSRNIVSIDLAPLSVCANLRKLNLSYNKLQTIDLSPLSSCISLQNLGLYNNQLQSIDLSPLKARTSLQVLNLGSNLLTAIDLSPLSQCTNLRILAVSENQLPNIDLSPLYTCSNLEQFSAGQNRFVHTDVTPLSNNVGLPYKEEEESISWLRREGSKYGRPQKVCSWSFLYRIVKQHDTDFRLQQDILYALGLDEYGFFDCDLRDLFLSIPPDTSIESVREEVVNELISQIGKIVESDKAAPGLALEKLIKKHPELAAIAPHILSHRNREMKRLAVTVKGSEVDLRELWLSAYGYEVLNALDMGLVTDLEGLQEITEALAELGFDLKTDRTSKSTINMEWQLKETIWWMAQYRGRSWRDIRRPVQRTNKSQSNRLMYDIYDDQPIQAQIDEAKKLISDCEELVLARSVRYRYRTCVFTDIDLSVFHTEYLKKVTVSGIAGTIDLSPLTNLTHIVITYFRLSDKEKDAPYVIFPMTETLEEVVIGAIVEHDRETLAQLPSLKKLEFRNLKDTDLSWLNESPSLTHIEASPELPNSIILPSIQTLETIKLASYRSRYSVKKPIDLRPLTKSKNLTQIVVNNQRIKEIDLAPLSQCQNLEVISFSACKLQTIDLSPIKVKKLREIRFSGNSLREFLLPEATNPEFVGLGGNLLESIDLGMLASSNLRQLELQNNRLKDIDLSPLSISTNLEVLELSDNSLYRLDLSPLSEMQHLKRVHLTNNDFREVDVTPLLSCPSLGYLNTRKVKLIADSRFSDDIKSPGLLKMRKKIKWFEKDKAEEELE